MKRRLLTILYCAGAMFTTSMNSEAQSTLIHYWNFNSFNKAMYTPTIATIDADYTRISGTEANILYTGLYSDTGNYNSYVDTLTAISSDFDTVNARMGAPSGVMMRARNNSDSMQLLFYIPSTNYANLVLKYATESSSATSGMLQQIFAYSNDNGVTWITSGSGLSTWNYSLHDTMSLVTVNINDALAANNPKLVFRITFSGNTHTTAAKGNNRFDNVTLEGDTITSTLGVNELTPAQPYTLSPNPVSNMLNISSDVDGIKSVIISNSIGQTVYKSTEDNKQITVNTENLNAGMYIISIRENNTGKVNTMKFVKQ